MDRGAVGDRIAAVYTMAEFDSGYKLLFSHPELVADLLRGFVPEPWVAEVDFTTLTPVKGSYVSEGLRQRHDDVVWKVRLREQWLYVYVVIEFQAEPDPFMALRLLVYVGLLYQDLLRRNELSQQRSLRRAFGIWLRRVFLRRRLPGVIVPEVDDLGEVNAKLAERWEQWTREWKQRGLQQGETRLLLRQLRQRFGELPGWVMERLAAAEPEQLEQRGERLLAAPTLEAVFEVPSESSH
jgi:predicted transposase YdaD